MSLPPAQSSIIPWLQAGPKDKLDSTAVSQPAIYVASLAALEKLKQDEGQVCGILLNHGQHLHCSQAVRLLRTYAFNCACERLVA